jgi:hypothetical protein
MLSTEQQLQRGPCARRRVTCDLMTAEGPTFHGENDCANPQAVCPRLPGEGYEKCQSICQQGAHAEIKAIHACVNAGYSAAGAVAIIQGHYYICEPCGAALRDAGVTQIRIQLRHR